MVNYSSPVKRAKGKPFKSCRLSWTKRIYKNVWALVFSSYIRVGLSFNVLKPGQRAGVMLLKNIHNGPSQSRILNVASVDWPNYGIRLWLVDIDTSWCHLTGLLMIGWSKVIVHFVVIEYPDPWSPFLWKIEVLLHLCLLVIVYCLFVS